VSWLLNQTIIKSNYASNWIQHASSTDYVEHAVCHPKPHRLYVFVTVSVRDREAIRS